MFVRLALVADIHHGKDTPTKRGSAALSLLESFIAEADLLAPELVIDLGDRINDTDLDSDIRHLGEVKHVLRGISAPRVHLLGNHDVAKLPVATSSAILGTDFVHKSSDLGGWHLIFWQADSRVRPGKGFELSDEDLAWLEADLAATELPSIAFTHAPLGSGPMLGNYYFESREAYGGYANAARAREIFSRSGKVVAAIAGHVHWNSLNTVDGVHYLTLQSLTETFTTNPHPAGAWAKLELGKKLDLEVFGRDPMHLSLPIKQLHSHWLARRDVETRVTVTG